MHAHIPPVSVFTILTLLFITPDSITSLSGAPSGRDMLELGPLQASWTPEVPSCALSLQGHCRPRGSTTYVLPSAPLHSMTLWGRSLHLSWILFLPPQLYCGETHDCQLVLWWPTVLSLRCFRRRASFSVLSRAASMASLSRCGGLHPLIHLIMFSLFTAILRQRRSRAGPPGGVAPYQRIGNKGNILLLSEGCCCRHTEFQASTLASNASYQLAKSLIYREASC